MKRIQTAAIATLGCKLNQSESEHMARQLAEAGVTLVPFGKPADLCLINTCTVTHIGDRKSRQLIRQSLRASPGAFVAVVGCYAELEPQAIESIPGVDAVLGNRGKERLLEALRTYSLAVGSAPAQPSVAQAPPRPGDAHHPAARTRGLVKIQEGCDNNCSYCIVPHARGHQVSRPTAEILQEIRGLTAEGYREVVLTGVNITAYGRDHGSPSAREDARGLGLLRLLRAIMAETDVPRIRLSSLQPEDWSPRFYEIWGSGRLCRHLHLSLQSGSSAVLGRMRRRYSAEQYARVVAEARLALPGVAITTDVIVGFPGETAAEFQETEQFLDSLRPAGLHIFKFSPRAGTPAAGMPAQVPPGLKRERSDRLIQLAERSGREFRARFLGSDLEVLWEESLPSGEAGRLGLPVGAGAPGWWTGLSDNYVRVYAPDGRELHGTIGIARVVSLAREGVVATPGPRPLPALGTGD